MCRWLKPFEETVFALVKDIPAGILPVAMGGVNEVWNLFYIHLYIFFLILSVYVHSCCYEWCQ